MLTSAGRLVFVALFIACLGIPMGTAHAYPLLTGLGGAADFGEQNLPENDDGSTDEIDVRAAFPRGLRFYGASFTSLFLNNNGNVTFGARLGGYTPRAFPIASQRMIAPWWGDVDTRGGGYPNRNGVFWDITPGRFVATWHNVGYFGSHIDLLNDFQLILIERSDVAVGDFDVEFRYNRCEWTTGDASGGTGGFGGTPAQAGFDAGDLVHFVALPGSRTMAILDVCRTSNVLAAGRWIFQIRSGDVSICGNGVRESGEECDDGNLIPFDTCSPICQWYRDDPAADVMQRPDVYDTGPEAMFDAGTDTTVVRDSGVDVREFIDVRIPPPDAEPEDVAENEACVGWRCGRENRLSGRAGPIGGCTCSVPGGVPRSRGQFAGLMALAAVLVVRSRRSRKR